LPCRSPDAVLPRQPLRPLLLRCSNFQRPCRSPALLYLLHLTSKDGRSRTSCASRHLHVLVQWRKCSRIVGNNPYHARQNNSCHVVVRPWVRRNKQRVRWTRCPLNGTKVHRTFVCFRFALLRLKDQGNPSVDFPFAGRIHALRSPCFAVAPAQAIRGLGAFGGVKVHRTFTCYRLTHWIFRTSPAYPRAATRPGDDTRREVQARVCLPGWCRQWGVAL